MVENERFTDAQRRTLDQRQAEQDLTLAAMHRLEAAVESAATGREGSWQVDVSSALLIFHEVARNAETSAAEPDSLLSDIARNQPRLRNRVRGIRAQYRQLQGTTWTMMRELEQTHAGAVDVADLRQRLTWIMNALRHVRARESDLIYEAYYDAFKADLGDEALREGSAAAEHSGSSDEAP
jgi:hypothetical protein